ncbi:TIGR02678 family protein [Rhodococcus sp. NPDC003318]|uniref:TIGR02678 family protein n=1 Tax=Rhodococcus sp. NPDC003318 TaxID=3364503 RepID=UPI003686AC80
MKAREISPLMLESYQRAARVILANHLVTTTYPDALALPLLRRWTTELRDDLLELFGYRLEVTETTARLFTAADRLDPTTPARTVGDRAFDRRRYAYLALALAALGRAGNQVTLSELAEHVAAEASQVPSVELSTERAADRDAFVDAVGWLAARGAITLADGDASGWASNPDAGEALYDIDRSVVIALFRPPRALQHLSSVRGLLAAPTEETATRETTRRVRRALVQQPVVYADELDDDERLQLALPRTAADVERLTGLVAERRAEGIALIDPSGRLSDVRFPSTGTVAQVALLLAGEIADRILDPDAPEPLRLPLPSPTTTDLVAQLDSAIPQATVLRELADAPDEPAETAAPVEPPPVYPFVEDSWIEATVTELVDRFGRTFAAQWQADTAGLRRRAVDLLDGQRLLRRTDGGVLVLPALARYRGVVVTVRERAPEPDLLSHPDTPSPAVPSREK